MAINSREIHTLYGHGARNISREEAGYRPKIDSDQKEPNRVMTLFWNVLSRIIPITFEEELTHRAPKGDPESYEIKDIF